MRVLRHAVEGEVGQGGEEAAGVVEAAAVAVLAAALVRGAGHPGHAATGALNSWVIPPRHSWRCTKNPQSHPQPPGGWGGGGRLTHRPLKKKNPQIGQPEKMQPGSILPCLCQADMGVPYWGAAAQTHPLPTAQLPPAQGC